MLTLLNSASLLMISSRIHLPKKSWVDSPHPIYTFYNTTSSERHLGAKILHPLISWAFVISVCLHLDYKLLRLLMDLIFYCQSVEETGRFRGVLDSTGFIFLSGSLWCHISRKNKHGWVYVPKACKTTEGTRDIVYIHFPVIL